MLIKCYLLILLVVAIADGIAVPEVDHVIASLSNQQWDEDEAVCRDKIFNLLDNVKNSTLWATWIWDASQHAPSGIFFGARFHLGNYDQCLRPSWLPEHPELRTQYCLADIEMSKNPREKTLDLPGPYGRAEEYYVNGTNNAGRNFSYMTYGVCLPVGCNDKSIERFVRALLRGQHLQAAWDANVRIDHCDEAGVTAEPSRGYYFYNYMFALLVLVALTSTYHVSKNPDITNENSLVSHVAKSFCLRRNWAAIFKEDKDALKCLHGLRVLTAYATIRAHVFIYRSKTSAVNAVQYDMLYTKFKGGPGATRFDISVDIFIAMAGLLLGKSLSTLDVTKPYNLLKFIMKRYLRLVGSLAVMSFYLAHVLLHTDDGPMFRKLLRKEQQDCENNWWLSLLMLGNYIKADSYCYLPTWSVYCDFHLYVITVVLLYIYRKNSRVGKIATTVVVVLGFLAPVITTYAYDFPAFWLYRFGHEFDMKLSKIFEKFYITSHNRMGTYMVGLLIGYVMSVYKPNDYKKVWSKVTSYLGFFAGLSMIYAVMVASFFAMNVSAHDPWVWLVPMLDRTIISGGILSIVAVCTYGDIPIVNSFLSWKAFQPLSQLTYGVYLTHSMLLYRNAMSLRDHVRLNEEDSSAQALGVMVISLIKSLILWLLVDAPLNNFAGRYLDTRSQPKDKGSSNGSTENERAIENSAEKQKTI